MVPTQPKTIIIKPVSSLCNLRCSYCYNAVEFRQHDIIPSMSFETAEKLHFSLLDFNKQCFNLIWHGGEPLLRGLSFYSEVVDLQTRLAQKPLGLKIKNSVMSNGIMITEDWANFFAKNNWRLGISIDGPQKVHDKFRVDSKHNGTFERALTGRRIAEKAGIAPGMIAVITSETVKYPAAYIYAHLKSIAESFEMSPCWEAACDGKIPEYVVYPQVFLEFLMSLFDIWWAEDNPQINIRLFNDLLHGVIGGRPKSCALNGSCANFIAVDADGSVYPCGKFAGIKEFNLGNIHSQQFTQIIQSQKYINYLNVAQTLPDKCQECKWLKACNNGCTYDRYLGKGQFSEITPFCEIWKALFHHIETKVRETMVSYKFVRLDSEKTI